MRSLFLLLALFTAATTAHAKTPDQLRNEFIDRMVSKHGFSRSAVTRTLYQAELRRPILEAIARPAEKRLNWSEYRAIFMKPERIEAGVKFWRENADEIRRISDEESLSTMFMD